MAIQNMLLIALIGISSGLLGGVLRLMGGAIIIIPMLVMFMGQSQQMTQSTADDHGASRRSFGGL
jgi:uncharacterized membrane protein YfcA